MKGELLINRWRTPDGTILQSHHRHDYVSHDDANGEYYFVDGGTDYIRMSQNKIPMEDLCLGTEDDFKEIRANLVRYSINGPVLLMNMSDDHLNALIPYMEEHGFKDSSHYKMYLKEIQFRKDNNIRILTPKYNEQ